MKIKGEDLLLFLNDAPVLYEKSTNLDINSELKECTRMPQSLWKTYYVAGMGFNIKSDAMVDVQMAVSGKITYYQLLHAMLTKQTLTFKMKDKNNIGQMIVGSVIISSLSKTSTNKEQVTYSVSLTGTGTLDYEGAN